MHDARMPDDTWTRIERVLREVAPLPPRPLRPDDRLVEDLGLDSMALVNAVVALEEAFGLELPQDRLHELRGATAGVLAGLVEQARSAA